MGLCVTKYESSVLSRNNSIITLPDDYKEGTSPSFRQMVDSPPVLQIQLGNSPPVEQTAKLIRKEEALRKLWLPGSIWAGTLTVNGIETPWEVHVERDSTLNKISAKRVNDFDHFTFISAERVEFFLAWEELKDERGNRSGWQEVITFEWLDTDYRLFADTLNGIIDVHRKKIEGLVVDNKTKSIGHFEFCRIMTNKRLGELGTIRTPTFMSDSERASKFAGAVQKTIRKEPTGNVEQISRSENTWNTTEK